MRVVCSVININTCKYVCIRDHIHNCTTTGFMLLSYTVSVFPYQERCVAAVLNAA